METIKDKEAVIKALKVSIIAMKGAWDKAPMAKAWDPTVQRLSNAVSDCEKVLLMLTNELSETHRAKEDSHIG